MKKKPYICITGPDGSGKTTLISSLVHRLAQNPGKKTAGITIWDLMFLPEEKKHISIASPGKVDRYLAGLHPVSRTLFLFHCFFQALAMAGEKEADIYFINAYWYKYAASEVAHGGDYETTLRLASIFPEPDLTVYLDIDPRTAAERKERFSGYECGFPPDGEGNRQDFIDFQKKSGKILKILMQDRHCITLDARDSIDTNRTNIIRELEERYY
jgi:thymidylate kinase